MTLSTSNQSAIFQSRVPNYFTLKFLPELDSWSLTSGRVTKDWDRKRLKYIKYSQCGQIWRNFATLAKLYKSLAIYEGLWEHFEPLLVNYLCFWANTNCCKWPNIEHVIKPFGHTEYIPPTQNLTNRLWYYFFFFFFFAKICTPRWYS